jgi:TetR/AcrR family transcriptional regulator, transcriptional repressor for nem operon
MSGGETRDKLVQEGLRLLLREGYSATGVKAVVDAAGVPKGSFYHFFPQGKEGFAAEVIELYAAHATRVRKELLLDSRRPPLERLRSYFEHYVEHFRVLGFKEGCLLGNLSAEVSDMSEGIRARLDAAFSAWESDVARVVAEAMERGDLEPRVSPAHIARHLINGWEGALLRMKSEKTQAALEEFLIVTFEVLLAPRKAGA